MRHSIPGSRPWRAVVLAILIAATTAASAYSQATSDEDFPSLTSDHPSAGILPLQHMAPGGEWLRNDDGYPYSWATTVGYVGLGVGRHAVGFASRLCRDFVVQFQFPFRYAAKEPMKFTLGAAGLLALVVTDHLTQPILAPQSALRENGLIEPAEQLSGAATKPTILAIVAGLGAFGIAANSPRERETSVMLVEAVFTSEIWTDVLKMASRRERPRQVEDGQAADWEGPSILFQSENPDAGGFKSFPSGHATGMWATATILAHQYPAHGVVPVLSYGTALVMSYSRMAVRAHWLSDVVVGGLIGYGCARQVLSAHRAERTMKNEPGLRVGIDATSDYMGLGLAYDF